MTHNRFHRPVPPPIRIVTGAARTAPGAVRTRPARKAPPGIGKATGRIIARLSPHTSTLDPGLVANWDAIAGPQLAKFCRPTRLCRDGRARVLEVAASHGAAAIHLQFHLTQLRDSVNAYLGRNAIVRIRISQRGSPVSKRGQRKNTAKSDGTVYSTSTYAARRREALRAEQAGKESQANRTSGLKTEGAPPLPRHEKGNLQNAIARLRVLGQAHKDRD